MIKETRYIDDGSDTVLYVEFQNGSVYRYANVPQKYYTIFTSAESAGKYFNDNIKAKYPAARLPHGFPKATNKDSND